jgi:DNA (cytosine-5)-methyltransferase 1
MAHFIELARQIKPKCVVIENVPTALSAWQKLFDEQIHDALPGYITHTAVLNASAFGAPQIRRRAFVVGLREDLGFSDFEFPSGPFDAVDVGNNLHTQTEQTLRFVSVAEAIDDLPALKPGQGADGVQYSVQPSSSYQRERRAGSLALFNHIARAHSQAFLNKISVIKPGEGNADLPDDQRFSDNYYSQAYARLHPKSIGFTVTANFRNPGSGRFTHYRDSRSITVREAARLQSFDDKFIFHGYETDQERHVGNAVPPLLAEALARHFGALLGGE